MAPIAPGMGQWNQTQPGAGGAPPPPGGGTNTTGGTPPPGGGSTTGNPWASNFGQPMNPWSMPYQGQFTAPMSGWQNQALTGYSNFVGSGDQGLGGARNYLNDVLGGKYLNFSSNPWLQQIQDNLGKTKAYSDAEGLRRIQSAMAAGGNALSGARAGAEGDFLGQSDANFNTLIGNLMNQNYGMERGFMDRAPGELAGLAGQEGAGYGQLFNMGTVPQNIQQSDLDRQYQDFQRQTGAMHQDYQYPDQLLMSLLYGGGYRGQYPNQYGNSIMDILGGQAGANNWGGTAMDFLGGLLGGGSTSTEQPQESAPDGIRYDGSMGGEGDTWDSNPFNRPAELGHDGPDQGSVLDYFSTPEDDTGVDEVGDRLMKRQPQIQEPMMMMLLEKLMEARQPIPRMQRQIPRGRGLADVLGHDAASVPGPVGYGDTNWYNQALTSAQSKATADAQKAANPPTNMAPALIAFLMQLLSGGGTGGKKPASSGTVGQAGTGGGQSRANQAGKSVSDFLKNIFSPGGGTKPNSMYPSPIGPNNAGGYQDFLNQNFGGAPASEYGSGQYDPYENWSSGMNDTFGGNEFGNYGGYNNWGGEDPFNLGGGNAAGDQQFSLGLDPSMFGGGLDTGGGGGGDDFGGFNPDNFGGDFGGGGLDFGGE